MAGWRGMMAPSTMSCPACGFDNPPGFRFCGSCGGRLEETSTSGPPPAAGLEDSAERRQLTVLFCDLVGSTDLSERLDPEDLRELVQEYQSACAAAIQSYDGHIAQYLGDGLLVYFGYPQAHEDDVQRGIHAGLGILDAMADLSRRLEARRGPSLAVRLGLHTGMVVAGEIGAGARREQLALGKTPNVAARLQGLAEPGTLVVSDAACRLAAGDFDFTSLGLHTLKGISHPVEVFQVTGVSGAEGRFAAAARRGLVPRVGRDGELAVLMKRFSEVRRGAGRAVLLTGEAGIGKSRLLHDLRERLAAEDLAWWTLHCSPFHENSALYPVAAFLRKALRFGRDESPAGRLRKLERAVGRSGLQRSEAVPLLAALLSIPATGHPAIALTPQKQKERTLAVLVAFVARLAAERPVVFVLEDLHWVDPSTMELLGLLLDRAPAARLLVLMTGRPSFEPPWPDALVPRLGLDRLDDGEIEALVLGLTGGRPLPAAVLSEIVRKTDGVPLFVEELTRMVLESGLLSERGGRYEFEGTLPALAIPSTLQDSLMARLDRLSAVKEIAQLGAVLGREFGFDMLHAVSSFPEDHLARGLARMVEAQILQQQGELPEATFLFRHALLQDAAYSSLLKSTRQRLHQRIALALEGQFRGRVEDRPELLAHHYTEAGLAEPAAGSWLAAGQRAVSRSANLEAVGHLGRGLELIPLLPEGSARDGLELALEITLAPTLCATRGYAAPEVERAFARAHVLCQRLGPAPQLLSILYGLVGFYFVRAELPRALALARELEESVKAEEPPGRIDALLPHITLGFVQLYRGDLEDSRRHLERLLALMPAGPGITFPTGEELHVTRLWLGLVLWHLGYPDQALALSESSLQAARESRHRVSLGFALCFTAWLRQLRGEPEAVRELARELIDLSREQGLFWGGLGTFHLGWTCAELGEEGHDEGIQSMRQGLDSYLALGSRVTQTYYLMMLARTMRRGEAGRWSLLDQALEASAATGEHLWESEIHRLYGETADDQAEAEGHLLRALEVARARGARSLELRAATSLARLRLRQGRCEEGHDLLAGVYGWFTEGFGTADLREARTLLEELRPA